MVDKIDSNVTGLRFAEEDSPGVLPGSPVWYGLEPNSYSDFGGQITTVARKPFTASRQRRKGVVTDLEASGGFNQDLTFNNTTRLMQGFLFADVRQKASSSPLNGPHVTMTAIVAANDDYTAASGLPTTIVANDLVFASGFGVAANNGLKLANATSTGTAISVTDGLAAEASPPAAAKVELVGHQFASSDLDVTLNGGLFRIVSAAFTMTGLPLVVGEWIFIGGDTSTLRFDNNVGFARVSAIAATYVEFDKASFTPQAETGTSKTVQIFYGSVIKNEDDPDLIVRRTYQLERTLGNDGDGTQAQYLVGAVANELTLNVAQADKVTIDMSFVGIDEEYVTGLEGVKSGDRPSLEALDCFNTSTDFARIKMAIVTNDVDVAPLVGLFTEMTLTVNNNVTADKAISILGAFETTVGGFDVSGSAEGYFSSVSALEAIRNNTDATIDLIMVKNNVGLLFDIPLVAQGGGRLSLEQDQPIKIPLENNAAEGVAGHTLLFQSFPYLPDIAE